MCSVGAACRLPGRLHGGPQQADPGKTSALLRHERPPMMTVGSRESVSTPKGGRPNSDTAGEFVRAAWSRGFTFPGLPILPRFGLGDCLPEFASSITVGSTPTNYG